MSYLFSIFDYNNGHNIDLIFYHFISKFTKNQYKQLGDREYEINNPSYRSFGMSLSV